MDDILRQFLESLTAIESSHEELGDSDVRQMIGDAVMDGFVRATKNYVLPLDFGMRSSDANFVVREALRTFIHAANGQAKNQSLEDFHERLASVQNRNVQTAERRDYEDFLGHTPPECYDNLGRVPSR